MLRQKLNRLFPIGLLMLAVGLILHNWAHTPYPEFAAGFLIGLALVFLVAGFFVRSKRIPG